MSAAQSTRHAVSATRVDAPDKVTGRARYAFEQPVNGAAYVWPVQSTIAKGTIRNVTPAPRSRCLACSPPSRPTTRRG
jgi:xanthine dehydrogenase YagR molybdenum-binding subunit